MCQSHQLSVNLWVWDSQGRHHGQMPSCPYQHLGLSNIFVVMYRCSHGCPTSPPTKIDAGQQRWGHVDIPQFMALGPMYLTHVRTWMWECRLWPSRKLDDDAPPWKSLWETSPPTKKKYTLNLVWTSIGSFLTISRFSSFIPMATPHSHMKVHGTHNYICVWGL